MPVYTGKLTYSPYASNENIIFDIPDGWVIHGRARVWSTWTKDAKGNEKTLAFGNKPYVLRDVNDDATTFTIRDLDNKNNYWFTGTRQDDSISLSLLNRHDVTCHSNIPLKLYGQA
jgi:hypothetical protein